MKVIPILLFMSLNITQMFCNNIDSLSKNVNHTTILEIKDADRIFKQKEEDAWDKYSPALIALITIIIASGASLLTARWQTNVSKRQLELMKEQIESSSKSALDQVRANNISAARIEWIQKLRPLLSDLIFKTTSFENLFDQMDKLLETKYPTKEDKEKSIELMQKLEANADSCDALWNQILLFLNRNEKEHRELIESFEKLSQNVSDKINSKPFERDVSEDELIDRSRAVLKTAWEQAKKIN